MQEVVETAAMQGLGTCAHAQLDEPLSTPRPMPRMQHSGGAPAAPSKGNSRSLGQDQTVHGSGATLGLWLASKGKAAASMSVSPEELDDALHVGKQPQKQPQKRKQPQEKHLARKMQQQQQQAPEATDDDGPAPAATAVTAGQLRGP